MIRYGIDLLLASGLLALPAAAAARADCFDWASPGAVIEEGTLRGLPSGPLRWRVGRSPAGGVHMHTGVQLHWRDREGRGHAQALFDEIQDGRPVLSREQGRLVLRVTYCARGEEEACRVTALPFAWDAASRRFQGVTQPARDTLAAAECDAP